MVNPCPESGHDLSFYGMDREDRVVFFRKWGKC